MAYRYIKAVRRGNSLLLSLQNNKCYQRQLQRNIHYFTKVGVSSNGLRSSHILNQIFNSRKFQKAECSTGGKKQNENDKEDDKDPNKNNPKLETLISVLFAAGLAGLFYLTVTDDTLTYNMEEMSMNEFLNGMIGEGNVEKLTIVNKEIVKIQYYDKTRKKAFFTIGSVALFEQLLEDVQKELGLDPGQFIKIQYKNVPTGDPMTRLLLAVFLVLTFAMFKKNGFTMKSVQGVTDMKSSTARKVKSDVLFKNVAGCEEAKVEIMEFVNFLKHPDQYKELGAKIPKGAILTGPPGTGKTLLAKATAGEAGVDFITVSGSEFQEMYVGLGPARVRDMFAMARKSAPSILFIDEIDAVGKKRAESYSHTEDQNTLNQILVEMDGFNQREGVIILAATNRVDVLDKALLRPGRFDRHIYVGLPDIKGRASIFKVYLKDITLEEGVDKDEYARKLSALTHSMAGADIANVCNEAALIAARDLSDYVAMEHFHKAIERVIGGLEKKSQVLSPEEKKVVAYHEAGHVVAGWFLEHAKPLLKVSIVPRGEALGYAQFQPQEQFLYNKEQILHEICVCLGGRASEDIHFGDFTTGALDDLKKVTKYAYSKVVTYGMSEEVGPVSYDWADGDQFYAQKPYSEKTAEMIDAEAKNIVDEAYEMTRNLLIKHKEEIGKIAERLIEKEKIDKADIEELIGKRPFVEKTTYDEFVEGTGSYEEDTTLPKGLEGWDKKVEKKETKEEDNEGDKENKGYKNKDGDKEKVMG